jgi:iron complex outermembrane receptor protein
MNKRLYLSAVAASCLLPFGCASAQTTNPLDQLSFDEQLRSSVDLPSNVQLDLQLYRIESLPEPTVPAYTELNARLGWFVTAALELAIQGRNLLHATHAEYGEANARSEIERSFHGLVRWRF